MIKKKFKNPKKRLKYILQFKYFFQGYTTVGVTASWDGVKNIYEKSKFCAATGVPLVFNIENPSMKPFRASINRKIGSVGNRCKPIIKHLHYDGNIECVSLAYNLAQRNFSDELIMTWINWIRTNPLSLDKVLTSHIFSLTEILFSVR